MPAAELTEGGMVACVVAGEEILICPLHRAKFDVRTGAPVTRPAEKSLVRFPVTLEDGKVKVTLSG